MPSVILFDRCFRYHQASLQTSWAEYNWHDVLFHLDKRIPQHASNQHKPASNPQAPSDQSCKVLMCLDYNKMARCMLLCPCVNRVGLPSWAHPVPQPQLSAVIAGHNLQQSYCGMPGPLASGTGQWHRGVWHFKGSAGRVLYPWYPRGSSDKQPTSQGRKPCISDLCPRARWSWRHYCARSWQNTTISLRISPKQSMQ